MTYKQTTIQIGKNGLTSGIIESLKLAFITHKVVKIPVLKSARSNREDVQKIADKILEKLGRKYSSKIIGFTIIIMKFRKDVR